MRVDADAAHANAASTIAEAEADTAADDAAAGHRSSRAGAVDDEGVVGRRWNHSAAEEATAPNGAQLAWARAAELPIARGRRLPPAGGASSGVVTKRAKHARAVGNATISSVAEGRRSRDGSRSGPILVATAAPAASSAVADAHPNAAGRAILERAARRGGRGREAIGGAAAAIDIMGCSVVRRGSIATDYAKACVVEGG